MTDPHNTPDARTLGFEPQSPAFAADPYSVYSQLRQQDTLPFYSDMNAYLLSRYDDVETVARSPEMVRSLETLVSRETIEAERRQANFHDMPNHEQFVQFSMLERDGADHRRLRMLVLGEFTRSVVAKHRTMIQRYVDKLIDELIEIEEIDFIGDLAAHVPGHVIGNVLGVPDEDCPQLRIWSENIVQYFDADRTPERKQLAESATAEFSDYLTALINERASAPRDDLLSMLIVARDAGKLNQSELISLAMLVLAGGHGSTIDVLGNGLYALLKHPEQMDALRDNPELIHSAVQEMFRYDSPLPFFHRYASEDVEIRGHAYPRGTKFGLLYGAANRDPAYFTGADDFKINRQPNRHVAFGRGAHLCLGNNLSRLDMEVIFLTLLQRTRSISLMNDDIKFKPGISARGLTRLPIRLKA